MPQLGIHASFRNNGLTVTVGDDGPHEGCVGAVTEWQLLSLERLNLLFDGFGFAGQCRLLNLQIDRFDQPAIGRHVVADFHQHDVAWNKFTSGDFLNGTLAPNTHDGHGQLLQCCQRFLGPIVLNKTKRRVQHDDSHDDNGVGVLVQEGRYALPQRSASRPSPR